MKTRIQRVGDDLAVMLPAPIADQTGLKPDAEVDVTLENGVVIARPVVRSQPTLDDLLQRVTDDNRHPESDTGPAVGREVW